MIFIKKPEFQRKNWKFMRNDGCLTCDVSMGYPFVPEKDVMVDISSTRQSIPRKAPSQLNFNKTGDSILKESHLSVQKDSNYE